MPSSRGAGSGNRSAADLTVMEQFLRQPRQGRVTALLLAQIDPSNRIATTFGHERCEAFSDVYAARLRGSLPPRTPVIRLSERRFAVLLDCGSMAQITETAVALTEKNCPQIEFSGCMFMVDVTIGIAVYPQHADDAATLLRRADVALKDARDDELPFSIYRPDATRQQTALWKFESELQSAVRQGDLEVHFQPKIALAAQRVCGMEALVRWRTQTGALRAAADFIPIAEKTALVVPITWFVFERVCQYVGKWGRLEKPFDIAVNVSPQVLSHREFTRRVEAVKAVLDAAGVTLTVELTEDSLVQSDDSSLRNLERLRALGIQVAIDDFGKGYSSLGYLKQIPATEIKIDKRFISALSADETDKQIVKTIIALAHAVNMRVVAEGVDSDEALRTLARLGCEMAQGFYIGRPMRGERVPAWIENYLSAEMTYRSRILPTVPGFALV